MFEEYLRAGPTTRINTRLGSACFYCVAELSPQLIYFWLGTSLKENLRDNAKKFVNSILKCEKLKNELEELTKFSKEVHNAFKKKNDQASVSSSVLILSPDTPAKSVLLTSDSCQPTTVVSSTESSNPDTSNTNGLTTTLSAINSPNSLIPDITNINNQDPAIDNDIVTQIEKYFEEQSFGKLKGKAGDNKVLPTIHEEVTSTNFKIKKISFPLGIFRTLCVHKIR